MAGIIHMALKPAYRKLQEAIFSNDFFWVNLCSTKVCPELVGTHEVTVVVPSSRDHRKAEDDESSIRDIPIYPH